MPPSPQTNYYVYMYLDPDNLPFYIGKGKGERYKISVHLYQRGSANGLLKSTIRKIGVDNIGIRFLHKNLSEADAFTKEKYWIWYIGRLRYDDGQLCNLSIGGDGGTSGIQLSREHREKIGRSHLGRKYPNRPPHSEERKRKISEALRGKKRPKEVGEKISLSKKGMIFSEETRRKMSIAARNRKNPQMGSVTEMGV